MSSRPPTAPPSRPQSQAPQSQAPQSRPLQSQAPQSRPPQSQAPQSMSGVVRPDRVASSASSTFDPRQAQALQVVPAKQVSVYRQINSSTKKIIPSNGVMMQATTVALEKDKPIILTFWWDSILRNVFLYSNTKERETIIQKVKENPEDEDEFTSRIMKDHGNGIFETENSIYIVVPDIQRR
jgi:hypothetical protein